MKRVMSGEENSELLMGVLKVKVFFLIISLRFFVAFVCCVCFFVALDELS